MSFIFTQLSRILILAKAEISWRKSEISGVNELVLSAYSLLTTANFSIEIN
jgi:hypothetical protein